MKPQIDLNKQFVILERRFSLASIIKKLPQNLVWKWAKIW